MDAMSLRCYAVIPGVGTSAMPVASVPSIKSYIHQKGTVQKGTQREAVASPPEPRACGMLPTCVRV